MNADDNMLESMFSTRVVALFRKHLITLLSTTLEAQIKYSTVLSFNFSRPSRLACLNEIIKFRSCQILFL